MITREIKVGDRLRSRGGFEVTVRELATDRQTFWDTQGRVWTSPCIKGSLWSRIDDPQPDPVNHPPHYTQGDIECIDAIRAALGRDGFIAYCRGNAMKYIWRCNHKNGVEDMHKAEWYINRANEEAVE
jgi:hypothetical protein